MELASLAVRSIIFILPSYFANSVPVVLGGGVPIDGGRKMGDGRRILGSGKTLRGFFAGVLAAVFIGAAEALVLPGTEFDIYGGSALSYLACGALLGVGTMVGDLVGSFIKRRQGIAQGKPSFLLDQLTFLAFAILFAYPIAWHLLSPQSVLFLAVLTYFVHAGANIVAHRFGLKKVPW
ncbi:MAG: CDP-2,3-bis-(O-geranylgeranyl)-sn-glycerol synthase [Candidatus Micrarchaeota archaeon]|nr:CDP-2,3-bis-(O-geranylgeranyl)-sn-glycerol synthase [Candidatus Micrarchaeota archaeon]